MLRPKIVVLDEPVSAHVSIRGARPRHGCALGVAGTRQNHRAGSPTRSVWSRPAPLEQLFSTIGLRGAADDVVHADLALSAFQIEENAVVTYAQAKLGWLVSQWPYITMERFERELVKCSIDPTAITQRKPSQILLCAP
jgi:hypothetical protein